MSQYMIDIDDEAVIKQINLILNTIINQEIKSCYSETGREVASAVKELIYNKKDEIIEMVVERATREIVKKGLPKLIDRFGEADR